MDAALRPDAATTRNALIAAAIALVIVLALHLAIMCAMAAVYGLAARRWRWMLDRWVVAGVGYGLLTWVAMNYVVVPLSRAGSPPFILTWFIDGLVVHVVLVGLVFAFVARRSLRAR